METLSPRSSSSPRQSSRLPAKLAFLLVSLSLGELGDGLNIFQGVYLVGVGGWNEGSVGLALSLMGLTALVVQPWAGDYVDKTVIDRRIFLAVASIVTAASASAVLWVRPGMNTDHMLIFITKVVEGVAASFIGPCVAALTLANFGPRHFDAVMASNLLWGHVGTVAAAILAGLVAYFLYPRTKYCFLVIGAAALTALFFIPYLPQGDQLMGRGFQGKFAIDEDGHLEQLDSDESTVAVDNRDKHPPVATNYLKIFLNKKTSLLCFIGFFFHFANANVLLVLGELMGQTNQNDGIPQRSAIPLIAGAIVTAQLTMAVATSVGNRLTIRGVGRKPLFLAGLLTLPVRCALLVLWRDAGNSWLLSTQVLDGIGAGLLGLVHPVREVLFSTYCES